MYVEGIVSVCGLIHLLPKNTIPTINQHVHKQIVASEVLTYGAKNKFHEHHRARRIKPHQAIL